MASPERDSFRALVAHRLLNPNSLKKASDTTEVVHFFGRAEHVSHSRVYRPWGYYESVDAGERFQVKHRLENAGTAPLCLIEVQSGSYLGEDDIERFEDRYNRR